MIKLRTLKRAMEYCNQDAKCGGIFQRHCADFVKYALCHVDATYESSGELHCVYVKGLLSWIIILHSAWCISFRPKEIYRVVPITYVYVNYRSPIGVNWDEKKITYPKEVQMNHLQSLFMQLKWPWSNVILRKNEDMFWRQHNLG